MAVSCNLNNKEISKELLVNKFNMTEDNQCGLKLNDQKIPLPNEPQRSPGFAQKQPAEVSDKEGVLKKFANSTGKHLFLIKLQVRLQHWCQVSEIFKSIYFEEHLRKTAPIVASLD